MLLNAVVYGKEYACLTVLAGSSLNQLPAKDIREFLLFPYLLFCRSAVCSQSSLHDFAILA